MLNTKIKPQCSMHLQLDQVSMWYAYNYTSSISVVWLQLHQAAKYNKPIMVKCLGFMA
jgi:hypothetical protein